MNKQSLEERFEEKFSMKGQFDGKFVEHATYCKDIEDFIRRELQTAREETIRECMEIIEDNIGSGLELDPLSFIHMGGKKDIYEVSMIQKIGDNPMVIPYQLFKVAIEKVVGEQVAKAVTTALSRLGEIKKEK